jgi:hypothetical protein
MSPASYRNAAAGASDDRPPSDPPPDAAAAILGRLDELRELARAIWGKLSRLEDELLTARPTRPDSEP